MESVNYRKKYEGFVYRTTSKNENRRKKTQRRILTVENIKISKLHFAFENKWINIILTFTLFLHLKKES